MIMELENLNEPYRNPIPDSAEAAPGNGGASADILCLSHLRWDFVFQRPQHLLTRFAKRRRVFFLEEPVRDAVPEPFLKIATRQEGVILAVPHIPALMPEAEVPNVMRELFDSMLARWGLESCVAWYYTPMALSFSAHLRPALTVYDCMDELSGFAGAPPAMAEMERRLIAKADLVFTGGVSLYEAKKRKHARVYAFPSSIDKEHFARARSGPADPPDQTGIRRPRIGYHGVIDERLDLRLLERIADLKPDWHWILVGPVCKIDPASLPKRPNLHYLGKKEYGELPRYLGNWDAAMMPFAHNPSTRFISPTKTPEYLAAGRPVVSTSIRDVVDPYGRSGLVQIADEAADFAAKCGMAMKLASHPDWRVRVDRFLANMSWDKTWSAMDALVASACRANAERGKRHV
jgi:glycosyltransferase involved in cell wall biosynthesis